MQSRSDVYDFLVRWEPFLLRSNMPPEGIPKPPSTPDNPRLVNLMCPSDSYYLETCTFAISLLLLSDKYILKTHPGCRVSPRLKSAGQSVGIDFTGKCDRAPNTLKAHALLEYAKTTNGGALQNDLQEALFKVSVQSSLINICCCF